MVERKPKPVTRERLVQGGHPIGQGHGRRVVKDLAVLEVLEPGATDRNTRGGHPVEGDRQRYLADPPPVGDRRGTLNPSTEVLAQELQRADPGLTALVVDWIGEHLGADPRVPEGLLKGSDRLCRAGRVALGEVALDGGRQA